MKSRLEDKYTAIKLRKDGYSYSEIQKIVSVSKGTLSGWFKYIDLSPEEQRQLELRASRNAGEGRERAALSNRLRREEREGVIFKKAESIFEQYKNEANFILGIGLFWAEGSKRTDSFQFINSDPKMLRFMIFWLREYIHIDTSDIYARLYSHEDFKLENYEEFWRTVLDIPKDHFRKTIYKPNKHGIFKKNPNYKGCLRLEVNGGIAILRLMKSLLNILEDRIKVLYS